MKRADFDAVLAEFEHLIREKGFTGSRGTYRLPGGVQFKFVLDKFGWDPQLGWAFLLEVQDNTRKDKWNNVTGEYRFQIGPHTLEKTIGRKTLINLYADNVMLRSRATGIWFVFDDVERLRAVLGLMLEPALAHIRAWAESVQANTN
ncbi:hypothetical protein [Saccharothrix variisporea]|uniref:DUF4304 domain-containing protein n=1 Tax=Saccharothrix variisporea TaxID=543527 RepID=A0A495X964_9PSEU|nr:hypothetical protein [Saccharothrix variisporea]RKT69404.1 hypothetical protein DFJ66_2625 [Saccharothrix variisporea]